MNRRRVSALALLFCGCADIAGFDGNPQMDPGQDCLSCHTATGVASALNFSVGGTVYPAAYAGTEGGLFSAEIDITDSNGRKLALLSNGAGNFYSAEAVEFPAMVAAKVGGQVFGMQSPAPNGHCNVCHSLTTNADGTFQPAPLPAYASDAGFSYSPPGHIYGFASACTGAVVTACPSPPPSFRNQVQAIVQTQCASCHLPGKSPPPLKNDTPPLDNYIDIKLGTGKSEEEVEACEMPPLDGTWFAMSPEQRQLLLSWFACGDPDN
jgi:mono/diheme cytochrome c family protein